jgi:DNA-binding transcriptional LysR family regulator
MELNLNQLKSFYYAATLGSITRAAEKLCISQPAVSQQIKCLESMYDVQLFIRRKKKLLLTPNGKLLCELAQDIFKLVDQAEKLLTEAQHTTLEVLRIGSTKQLVRFLLAKYIAQFRREFPRVQIQVNEGSSEEMLRSVAENRNDIVIVGHMSYEDHFEVIPFIQDELVALVATDHRLAGFTVAPIEELVGENLILRERGSGTRRLIDRILAEQNISTSGSIETNNVDFIKEWVKTGGGITLLPRMGVDEEVLRGEICAIPLAGGPHLLGIDIVFDKERPLSQADQAFVNLLVRAKEDDQPVYSFHVFGGGK